MNKVKWSKPNNPTKTDLWNRFCTRCSAEYEDELSGLPHTTYGDCIQYLKRKIEYIQEKIDNLVTSKGDEYDGK